MSKFKNIGLLTFAILLHSAPICPNETANARNIFTAAATDDEEKVRSLLESGININQQNQQGVSPLMVAVRWGHERIVQLLIDAGARVDLQNNRGMTALMFAAIHGHNRIVQILLKAGPDTIDQLDNNGLSPLVAAAFNNQELIVQMLLESGASLPTTEHWAVIAELSGMSAAKINQAKQLIADITRSEPVRKRVALAQQYLESQGMPEAIARLIQQIGVEGLPPEKERPIPDEK